MRYVEAWWAALKVHLLTNVQEALEHFLWQFFTRLTQNR